MSFTDFVTIPPYNVVQPGAYSAVNASLIGAPTASGAPVPAAIGVALGGQPDTPLFFSGPQQMLSVLKGQAGYDVARFCFDGGAPQVCFVRVGNSITQAVLALAGATASPVTLTSLDWGSWCNAITVSVATGPVITVMYTDALGNVYTESWNFTSIGTLTPAIIAAAINGQLYGFNGSNYVSAAVTSGALPLTVVSSTPLAGGTDGLVPVAGDWTNGLTALQAAAVDLVVPATSTASVHAQVLAHCQLMSQPGARMERVMVAGGALGESVAAQITRMAGLQSARAELVYPGMQDYNAAGALTLYDSFYMAGKIAGMHAAQPDVATSIMHQRVPIVSTEVPLATILGGPLDQLLQAGVTPVAAAPGSGFWVVDALTGYNAPDGTFRDMIHTRSADYVSQYARHTLETLFVGSKLTGSTQNSIGQAANGVMQKLLGMQIIQAFLPSLPTPGPKNGSWNVPLPVMLVDTNKFIFITVQLQPSSTIQSSTTTSDTLS